MHEFLAKAPLLAGLPPDDLQRLSQQTTEQALVAGERLFEEGDAGDACYFIKEGKLAVTKRSGDQELLLAERGPGNVIGEMALIDDTPRLASISAVEDSLLIVVSKDAFQNLLATSPTAAMNTLHTFASRLRETRAALHQSEKMSALGTMTSGIAHELNNPASAAHRAAEQLNTTLLTMQESALALMASATDPGQLEAIRRLRDDLTARATAPRPLDALTRSDLEAEMEDALAARGVSEPWQLAPPLVSAGFAPDQVSALLDPFAPDALPAVLAWTAASFDAFTLLHEIRTSAKRLSEIVGAMKQYVYLDRAPVQDVDIHEGIESTLTILGHKLKEGVSVTRDYATDLPRITAFGSELAQVWTNIISNGIDAMDGSGHLIIHTGRDDDHLVVEITDDGPGIPEELQPHIFEPFFTTKAPGEGTGLGMHISHNIVVNRHLGTIQFDSRPGQTTFVVRLPIHGSPNA